MSYPRTIGAGLLGLALAGTGCNALLGNSVHDYDPDASMTAVVDLNDGASPGADATTVVDAAGVAPSSDGSTTGPTQGDENPGAPPSGDGATGPLTCNTGLKICGNQCVSIDDPNYGCGATTCTSAGCPEAGTGALSCQGGACVVGTCATGTKMCGDQCVSTDDPTYGCAGTTCDTSTCPDAGGGALACQNGACVVGTCPTGMKNCAGSCVSIDDPTYGCGATTCNNSSCPAAGTGTLGCQAGTCVLASCGTGTKLCAGKCVSVDDPTYGCGATTCDSSSCPAPGTGTLVCQAGACVIGACGANTKKCGSQCVPLDTNHGCGDTTVCTACAANQTCVGSPTSECTCVPDNVTACANKNCGTATNNCAATVSCGSCTTPQTCGGGGVADVCGCAPVTPCNDVQCGMLSDGCGHTVSCGCSGSNSCGAVTAGVCGCKPKTSATLCANNACGSFSDGCGGTVTCTCPSGDVCGGSGVCVCNPKTSATLCANNACGSFSNGCGGTVTCTCPSGDVCGGSGVCVCNPKTSATLCANNACGSFSNGCGGTVTCTCTNAPDNMIAYCGNSGFCATECAISTFNCNGASVCGSWDFASGTDGWVAESGFDFDSHGAISTTASAPGGGGPALTVGLSATDVGIIAVDGPLCASGVNLGIPTISAEVYLESTQQIGPDGGTIGVCVGTAGGAEVTGGDACVGSQSTLVTGQWFTVSGIPSGGDLSSVTTVSVTVLLADAWTGTVYIKNVQIN